MDQVVANADDYVRSRPRRSRARPRLNVNLTSLIDVTFLLLIYFMVATNMTMGEEAYRMDLPDRSAISANSQHDPFSLDQEPLRIVVASTGPRFDDYHLSIDGPYQQPTTFEELMVFLRKSQINDENAGSVMLFEPKHPIIIQPSRGARWEHAIEAFNAAARARYTNITFGKAN